MKTRHKGGVVLINMHIKGRDEVFAVHFLRDANNLHFSIAAMYQKCPEGYQLTDTLVSSLPIIGMLMNKLTEKLVRK